MTLSVREQILIQKFLLDLDTVIPDHQRLIDSAEFAAKLAALIEESKRCN